MTLPIANKKKYYFQVGGIFFYFLYVKFDKFKGKFRNQIGFACAGSNPAVCEQLQTCPSG